MKIDRLSGTTPLSATPDATVRRDTGGSPAEQGTPAVSRRDSVQISAQGRELAAQGSERLADIRARLAEGAYDTPEVLEAVARRLLASGDV